MKPRLLVIGALPPPHHGVTISTSLVLANAQLARCFDISHLDTSDRRNIQNIGIVDLQNVWLGLRSLGALARRLRGRPGVVYLPLSQSLPAVLRDSLYIRLAAARGWKVAVHLRGGEFTEFLAAQPRLARWWLRGSLQRVSSVGVMGDSLRWLFEELVPGERIAVVCNGTPDLDLGTTPRAEETGLYLGNLLRRKGVEEALEAVLAVLRERPDARFIFAGEWESAELERTMRDRARAAGDRIEFRGVVTHDAKREVLAGASYLLFPPRLPEGHPRVVLEALAAGLPVVTTDRGAIAETVVDGESGFVLDEPVPEQLAACILKLLSEPQLRARMGRAARDRYLGHFTQEIADRRMVEWLSGLSG
jgi:glycosyltransferase involved in cell wall biosynthesis